MLEREKQFFKNKGETHSSQVNSGLCKQLMQFYLSEVTERSKFPTRPNSQYT